MSQVKCTTIALKVCLFSSLLIFRLLQVAVTMQAPKEAPPDMQCRDKFLVQSVVVPNGTTNKDINQEMVG